MKKETQVDLVILISLIRAVSNQCLMLQDKDLRHLFKQSFNRLHKESDKLYNLIEKTSDFNLSVFDEILDEIENNTGKIRKQIKLK